MKNAAALGLLLASCATSSPGGLDVDDAPGHRVAIVQYEIRGDVSADGVLHRARALVDRASRGGAALVVFPELFVLDAWPLDSTESEAAVTRAIARDVTPIVLEGLRATARDTGLAILAGSAPELRDGDLFNTARLLFPGGREVAQDKVHPTAWGRRVGMTPGSRVRVFEAPWGRTAMLICYDVEFPSITADLVERAPEVLLVPSMTESESGRYRVRWTAQARAVEHHAFVVVAPTVGVTTDHWRHFGRAVALTPRAPDFPGVLAEASSDREGVTFATLDLAKLRESRGTSTFHPAHDERRRLEAPARKEPAKVTGSDGSAR